LKGQKVCGIRKKIQNERMEVERGHVGGTVFQNKKTHY